MKYAAALSRESLVAQHIPYAAHVSEKVVRTHSGDYVQAFRLAGASFESADDETLNNWHERLNVTWRNLAAPNVALWTHVIRRRQSVSSDPGLGAGFADELTARYQQRLSGERLMINEIYLSLIYRPVTGAASGLTAKWLSRRRRGADSHDVADALDACEKLGQMLCASLARYEPQNLDIYWHSDWAHSRLLEFLALLINGELQPVRLPRAPLNDALATSRLIFGSEVIEYRLPTQTRLGAMLAIKEYPTPTTVGMINALLVAPFAFVLTQSFSFLSKATGQGLLQRQRARMANAGDFATSQAEELGEALDALTSNEFVMGDHHLTLQVLAETSLSTQGNAEEPLARLNDAVAQARALLSDAGMTVAREDLALEGAFWSQLPGNFGLRPRKAPITSRNFAALAPFHNFPTGRATGNHWGNALSLLITSAHSPYYFSLHASDPRDRQGGSRKDTGHTFICGPTGSGKTVLIGFLVTMLARQGVSQVLFDKDRGLEILVRALGGRYLPIRNGEATGFNPLQLPETPGNLEFLRAWLRSLLQGVQPLSRREENDLDHALNGTLALEQSVRRLSRLIEFTDPTRADGLHMRLSRWCESTAGDYAWAFDNPHDALQERLEGQSLIGFDVTDFLDSPIVRTPTTMYLFHCVRQLLDGRRFVCWADEFSRLLADSAFEQFARDGLKVWRKSNGVFCAATQSPGDALSSPISRTIIEQTATKVFFPNPDANAQDYIEGFALTEREFKLIKTQLEPGSRMFLIKQGHDSVVCQLDLQGFDAQLAVISGRTSAVEALHRIMAEVGTDPAQWLGRFQAMASPQLT